MPIIPNTKLRLKAYITLQTIRGGAPIVDPTNIPATIAAMRNNFTTIGAVESFSYKNSRDAKYYRELKTSSSAQIVETFPGLPEYELTLTRTLLITENVMEAFGFTNQSMDIINQSVPIMLQLLLPGINGGTSSEGAQTITFHGVWLKDNPFAFDVKDKDDLRIVQEINAIAAGVYTS